MRRVKWQTCASTAANSPPQVQDTCVNQANRQDALMAPKRRKSVSFNPNPDELSGPSTRRRNLLAETPAPAAQLKRAAPAPPAQPESDDGFKFKRRKPASKAAPSREPEPAPTPAPAAAPAPSSRSTRASRAAASASTPAPAAAAPAPAPASKAPKAPKAPVASTGLIPTREAESAAGPADAGVEAVAAGPAMNLDGVPPEMLRALLQACLAIEPGDAANDGEAAETQRAVSECMHEIRRQGVFQVRHILVCPPLPPHETLVQGKARHVEGGSISEGASLCKRRSTLRTRTSRCASARRRCSGAWRC